MRSLSTRVKACAVPAKAQHLLTATENVRFSASDSVRDGFPGWSITGLFYAALHYVDAYLATQGAPGGIHPASHVARGALVATDPVLAQIYPQYRRLKDRSEDARYRLFTFTPADVERLAQNELASIQEQVAPLL